MANLQRMLGWQDVLQANLSRQRDEALSEQKVFAGKRELAQQALSTLQARPVADKAALDIAHRAAKDRWLREVDRERQDKAKVAAHLQQVERA